MTAPAAHCPTPLDLARKARTPAPAPGPAPATAAKPARGRPKQAESQPRPRKPYVRRKLTAEEAIAPGQLTKGEHFRPSFALALTISRLPAHARLVGHGLLWRAHYSTGKVPADQLPGPEVIADATGLTPGQVLVAIEVLHTRGWLIKHQLRSGATVIDLVIPAGVLEEVRVLRSQRPAN